MAQPRTKLPGFSYRKCLHCGKPFRVIPSMTRRRLAAFCTRQCHAAALRKFLATYTGLRDQELDKAA